MPVKLIFALRKHQMLSIEEVDRGLACNCYCPQCNARLVAKKGDKQIHHFAHFNRSDCDGALETSLHLMAKQIIAQQKRMVLPPVHLHRQDGVLSGARLIQFEKVQVEQYVDHFTPDLTLVKGDKKLHVEILVTHSVENKKLYWIRKKSIPVIEIDVMSIYEDLIKTYTQLSAKKLAQVLIHGTAHKVWLFNAKKEKIEYALRKRSICKPVRHQLYNGYHNYLVRDCPLNKRFRRGHFLHRQSYANVLQDCNFCHRCLEINYYTEWVGFKEVPVSPKNVNCWGHLPKPSIPPWWEPI